MATIAILGTLDSKAEEHSFLAERIRERGHNAALIDVGTGGEPQITPDYSRYEVAAATGVDLKSLIERHDRGACVVAMSEAAPIFLAQLVEAGTIDGVVSLGGGGGTAIGTAAMRALPIGFPKLMVSTLASGNTAHYVGTKDIVMMPSIVDVSGLNRISRTIFTRAAGAICGMVETKIDEEGGKPLIVASMFGNTTTCVNEAKAILEEAGYEVLVFHATGSGGQAMESLIESGMVSGVLDVTTTEWADEVVGATLSAGPTRMDAMTKAKVPAVVAPGCVDMANFGSRKTVPPKFEGRNFYIHNPQVTLMRTNARECAEIGKVIAIKANVNTAPVAILNPLKAVSEINGEGQAFYDQEADTALFKAIRTNAQVEVIDLEETINSFVFARACAEKLLELIQRGKP
ncbi:Tm-1-like ATP-binding domain-containing protein [Candidatus Pelagisphaera phototrophica]|uniref:Tm-1-like ATP-binding domain-containing protein n=1 Tax=Candidatus Pelagisphaera phototrophica TaxID=2684113 RepID=UPI0019E28C48|nr:Tm-1-like ATP-binding domain-containing protein [Candidatus Pelagisphaera phototrophica]QXD32612.1 Tm-1-like ATP-binding domain-containing protein [Candidatus Pelagisphaera phototrophica]